jgi:HD-GYP domain-containing protein (c-di-GMP phosphodiesterase class II)
VTPVETLAAVMARHDAELAGHAERVTAHAEAIAARIGWQDQRLEGLRLGAVLHDIGKVRVRAEVLAKPGRLDADELAEIRTHPVEGAWLLARVPALAPALPYALFHHERWDGDGYPTRRAGDEIPLEGRIMALADSFDAMTSERPYRAALTVDDALDEVRRGAGTQFDPELAEILVDVVERGVPAAA